jgi:hypothetical protein
VAATGPAGSPAAKALCGCCGLPWGTVGRIAIFAGFALIILCRGWDGVGNRGVMRIASQNNYKVSKDRLDSELGNMSAKDMKDLETRRKKLDSETEEASADNMAWGYWRECLFPIGAIILVGGLVAVSMVGVGTERIISMIMLSIITFSLFIGGCAWLSSIVNNVMSAASQAKHAF